MELQPVHCYPKPQLPTREIVDQNPDLLRLLPRRWQGNAAVVTALAAVLAMSSASRASAAQESTQLRVAPIFTHGYGAGSYGCVTVCPPVFLSEDEARAVIRDEAKSAGLSLHLDTSVRVEVELPITWWEFSRSADGEPKETCKTGNLVRKIVLDAVDEKHNVVVEFVSSRDVGEVLGNPNDPVMSAGTDFVKRAAVNLREALARTKPDRIYGIFYDPVEHYWMPTAGKLSYKPNWGTTPADREKEQRKLDAMTKDLSREQLRLQVKDFIKWLKAQGVI